MKFLNLPSMINPRTFYLVLCLMIAGRCLPQGSIYNREITFISDTLSEQIAGTVELNGHTYAVFGLYGDHYSHIGIAEIDNSGNKLWAKEYGDDTAHYYQPGFYQAATATSDGNIVVAGLQWNWGSSFNSRTVLFKFTIAGDTLWTRLIMPQLYPDIYTRGRGVIETQDKGFAIMGNTAELSFFCKTDSLGRVEFYKTFPGDSINQGYEINSIHQLPDGNYLLSGTVKHPTTADSWVCILDEQGEISREWMAPGETDAFALSDGKTGYMVASHNPKSWGKSPTTWGNKMHLIHYDMEGSIISDKFYGDSLTVYTINAMVTLPDSTFLVCGAKYHNYKGFIFNFNRDADSLFYREITFYPQDSSMTKGYWFSSVTVCSDSSIFLGGEYDTLVMQTLKPRGWIVRADRYGCFTPGCDPNAIFIYRQPPPVLLPVSDTVNLSVGVTGDSLVYQWQYKVDSIWKNITDSIHFIIDGDTLTIKTDGLPAGVYFIRCRISNEAYTVYSQETMLQISSGIWDPGQRNGLSVYPNPVQGKLYIRSQVPIVLIKITGYSGNEIGTIQGDNHKDMTLDMINRPTGICILTIITADGCVNRKIVKQ
jgi:hypothetical protein